MRLSERAGFGCDLLFFDRHRGPDVTRFVDVQNAVEVIHFMLQAAREEIALRLDRNLAPVTIEPRTHHPLETRDVADETGNGETALNRLDLPFRNRESRVDENERPVSVFLIIAQVIIAQVDDEHAFSDVDLRRGESDSRRLVHRREHIVD